jgi:hypothetical protein
MNFNILWAFPTDILLVFLIVKKPRGQWCRYLLVLKIGINFLILVGWKFLPQPLHAAVIPFMMINILRGGFLLRLFSGSSIVREPKP